MPERRLLSKKLRFDVFKRDAFTCQYCGNTPPQIVLEVDHIIPVSKKGTNQIENLITSCFDCNRGKSNHELNCLPDSTAAKISILKEKELQYKAYQKLLKSIENRLYNEVEIVKKLFLSRFPWAENNSSFNPLSVKNFIQKISLTEVINAMEKACYKVSNAYDSFKYFCGICWSIIKEKKNV